MGGLTVLLRPLNLASTVILARLLDPSDFGLVALAMLLLSTSNLFSGLGMGPAVIHSPFERKEIAFPGFLITLLTGTCFYGLIHLNLDGIAYLLGSTKVIPIVVWLSTLVLFNSLNIVPYALLRKEMMFRQISVIVAFQEITQLVAAVSFAYFGFGVWSLVYAQLASRIARTSLVWWLSPGWDWVIPRTIDWSKTKELTTYGLKTFGSGLVAYFHSNWDDWLVGRMLGDASLGLYNKAYQFSNKTIGKIGKNTIGTVFFSTYVKLRGDDDSIRRVYLKSVEMVLAVMVPIALGMSTLGPEIISVVFGEKWIPMTLTFQIFALVILCRPISENSAPFFQALGHPEYNFRAGILLLLVMVPLALLFFQWGISGVALAVVLSHFMGAAYNIYQTETLISDIARPTLLAAGRTYSAGLIMVGGLLATKFYLLPELVLPNALLNLLLLIGLGAVFYAVGLFLTQRELFFEILRILLGRVQKVQNRLPASLQRYFATSKAQSAKA